MVLAYPLALDDFFDLLPIAEMSLDIPEQAQMDQTGKGELITVDIGERLWQGTVTVTAMKRTNSNELRALLNLVRGAGKTFFAYDQQRPGPQFDPDGYILSDAAPTILALDTDTRLMSVQGLPPSYLLKRGDLIGWAYGSAPTRYAVHEIMEKTVLSAADGTTPLFEVNPPIRSGAAVGAAVSFHKVPFVAQVRPGTTQGGSSRANAFSGMQFKIIQTLGSPYA